MADADLFIIVDEIDVEFRQGATNKEGRASQWAFANYEAWLFHISGVSWGPLRRHIALPMTGPQTYGSAESYVQKRLLRALFMVPTGDKDADDTAPSTTDAPTATRARPAVQRPTDDRATANGIYARISSDIKNARSIEDLNSRGVFGPSSVADERAIRAQPSGAAVWQKLIDADAYRRSELAPLPDDDLPDFGQAAK
jgi:hypothetical protein